MNRLNQRRSFFREKDIKHETKQCEFFVLDFGDSYGVMQNAGTHSISECFFARSKDGLSLAIARADYREKVQRTRRGEL
jgi:hypothetical protein